MLNWVGTAGVKLPVEVGASSLVLLVERWIEITVWVVLTR